ncbi:hypothetical protein GTY54_24535, partial [Streptomyces sp. SID625]|nr:hypothetical protein [Streptomyces sp. SID625]
PGPQADETGVLALVGTEFDAKTWSKRHRDAEHGIEGAVAPYPLDAEPRGSRLLARHGALARFLAKPEKKRAPAPRTRNRRPSSPLEAPGRELTRHWARHWVGSSYACEDDQVPLWAGA